MARDVSNFIPVTIPPNPNGNQQRALSEPVQYFQGGPNEIQLELMMLMPYLSKLAGKGQQIAGWLGMTDEWEHITLQPGNHLQTLIERWLDGDQNPKTPHTLSFFVRIVRGCGKGQLANKMEREIRGGQVPMPELSEPIGGRQQALVPDGQVPMSLYTGLVGGPQQGSSLKKVVQFAIMTANKNEWESARHFLGDTDVRLDENIHEKVKSIKCDDVGFSNENVKYVKKVHGYCLIDVGGIQGVLVKCPDIGSFTKEGSFRTTLELLQERVPTEIKWHISVIFIVGCCGGWKEQPKQETVEPPLIDLGSDIHTGPTTAVTTIPKEPVREGTVLVAESIIQYAIGKFEDGKINYGGKTHDVGDFWPGKVQLAYDAGNYIPGVYKATFLSGDFVIKDEDATEDLAQILRGQKYVGLEMEGIGVKKAIEAYEIFHDGSKPSPLKMVLVKGVSDRANMDKKKTKKINFFSEELVDVNENSCQQMCTIMSLTLVLRAIIAHKDKFQKNLC